jgi:predicted short-subunit dehydrogenase-like oxidoreductase (DUF2520 family)
MQKSLQNRRSQSRLRAHKSPAKKKLHVAIIGAGRMGTALGLALKAAGYQIEVVVTKRPSRARRAANAIGGQTLGLSVQQMERLSQAQAERFMTSSLIVIATPDDAIAGAAQSLAGLLKSNPAAPAKGQHRRRTALHTSGALSSEVLRPLQSAGFATGSLHPLVSISDSVSGASALAQAFFSIEGEPAAVRVARSMVRSFGGQSFLIESRHKSLYHAAAVMASPHTVALLDIALEMLGRCRISPERARKVLLPLMESTVANLATQNPAHALTGTFLRGDVATVRSHLAAIKSEKLRDALSAYVLLGQRSLSLARSRSSLPRLKQIAKILANATENRDK